MRWASAAVDLLPEHAEGPDAARYSASHLSFLDQPADIAQMTHEADLAVTYASLATTTAFLLAGKPLLLMPGHLEQFLVARRVEEMGAGRLVNPEQPPGDLRGMIADLIDNPAWRTNAEPLRQSTRPSTNRRSSAISSAASTK